ncbi:MAG: acyl-CoA thioesterase-2 [Myxococcota bacterium]|jgi:acyl-CoA thioesterase-2
MALDAQAALIDRLNLEELDQDLYRGYNEPNRTGRIFGGQVAAQSLMAAGRTVDGLLAHSLHGYFLRAGDPDIPVIYTVDRIRDGRSFVTRRVVATQRGKAIFNMACSFHKPEEGLAHQIKMPDAPDPESIPTWAERIGPLWEKTPEKIRKIWRPGARPIDMREVNVPVYLGGEATGGENLIWLKTPGPVPDDPFLHQCILAYATDFSLIDTMLRQHKERGPWGSLMTASLDHAIWFHAPLRIDDWLLYYQDSPVTGGARGYARGSIYTREGVLVASAAQEGLMRPVTPTKAEDRSI